MSTSTPSRSSSPDIQTLLAEFDASGQSAASFARSRGVPSWRLYHALNRRRGKSRARVAAPATSAPALLPVHLIERATSAAPAPALEILLAGGHRIRVGADFDARLLRRVIEALGPC